MNQPSTAQARAGASAHQVGLTHSWNLPNAESAPTTLASNRSFSPNDSVGTSDAPAVFRAANYIRINSDQIGCNARVSPCCSMAQGRDKRAHLRHMHPSQSWVEPKQEFLKPLGRHAGTTNLCQVYV